MVERVEMAAGGAVGRTVAEIRAGLARELDRLDQEAAEIEMLVQQTRTELERHEGRRAKGEQRLTALERDPRPDLTALQEARAQLLTLSRRATLMESHVQVLDGKQKGLQRYRQRISELDSELAALPDSTSPSTGPEAADRTNGRPAQTAIDTPQAVLRAQEEMRKEIARQMHDGPAQSLANIALQAEIVQRLLERDPRTAAEEIDELRRMVQRALDATKSFIFDVRPMVLDDLGLVPTLRRAASDRGKRTGVRIDFESQGADRRLTADLETAFFRIIDDALVGFLSLRPAQLDLRLEWSEREVKAVVRSVRPDERASLTGSAGDGTDADRTDAEATDADGTDEAQLPAALAAMIEQQRAEDLQARTHARTLPQQRWREIQARADAIGVVVQLLDAGQTMEATAQTTA
jgi:two-component system sensor histidine kinase DegS